MKIPMEVAAMVDPNFFNDVPIFELLDAEERKVLADQVSIREFKGGQVVDQIRGLRSKKDLKETFDRVAK